ncbi:AAA family ATPase [Peribacillus deserti]|uniref:Magnesium chelatase n=1 Tax=Peribacillus deserti TaxID=673318 RepID=A0A2N5M2E1_9BACI|nr:MoxR family ATPase [Peribacillus deserti]PLT28530.1 magnesium chelatase [Peribacillus deserti]
MNKLAALKENIEKVLVGKSDVIDLLMQCLLANGHVLLEDVPGTGKTVLAKSAAKSIGGTFSRIQFTPDVLPGDITGIEYFNPQTNQFETRIGPVYSNIILADEINRAMPRTQSSLLEAMEERQITIEKNTYSLPKPFIVIATQNPLESQGTFPLPEAQLDRFLMCIPMGYPSFEDEKTIMRKYRNDMPLDELEPCIALEDLALLQEQTKAVYLSEAVEDYILQLVTATRDHSWIGQGLSPRATLGFMRSVQAKAVLAGRGYCTPDDVIKTFPYIAQHRIALSMEGSLRTTSIEVIKEILKEIDVPVEIAR